MGKKTAGSNGNDRKSNDKPLDHGATSPIS
jgi:hypothetical protein